ncbi:hypothetical protein MKY25_16880 [Geobacillus sp. FSL W8-0032]|uniref:hypothetical protein n=1 Tax=Geobacillus TaxID=129337 RepID=UPI000501ACE4|nr:hypothetical protein [Geobacillus icigianus]
MVVIKLCSVNSCAELDSDRNPLDIKKVFTPLDKYCIVHCVVSNVQKTDKFVEMIWHHPYGEAIFGVKIELDQKKAIQKVFSIVHFSFFLHLEKPDGIWAVHIMPFGFKWDLEIRTFGFRDNGMLSTYDFKV